MIPWMIATAAAAELWWVPDEPTAETLRVALRTDWSDQAAEVVVGGRPQDAYGWTWDGGVLEVRSVDATRRADAQDVRVAVLFARTWNLKTETPGWERWLPAGEFDRVSEQILDAPEIVRHELPSPKLRRVSKRPWSLGVGVGTRSTSAFAPDLSLRVPAELVVGSWYLGADGSFDTSPWTFGTGQSGLSEGVQDLASATLESGGRTRGRTWFSAGGGLQYRVAGPSLSRDGRVVSRFERPVGAALIDLGVGRDFSFSRVGLHGWLRSSWTLPVTAGVDLDFLVFAHQRRR